MSVSVGLGVLVKVGEGVLVNVGRSVGVCVRVGVGVRVEVDVAVLVEVGVRVGVRVGVWVNVAGRPGSLVLVRLITRMVTVAVGVSVAFGGTVFVKGGTNRKNGLAVGVKGMRAAVTVGVKVGV